MPSEPNRTYNIYLLKNEITIPSEAVKESSPEPINLSLSSTGAWALLYPRPLASKPPRWAHVFSGIADLSVFGTVQSSAALLIVQSGGRLFAVCFGHGKSMLKPDSYVERFGLRVALNSIGKGNIRSLSKKSFDEIGKNASEQAIKESDVESFGLDIEQDLLRAVTGSPEDNTLGKRMSGKDALSVTVPAGLEQLPLLLSRYLEQYTSDSYKSNYPWVDQIAEVSSKSWVSDLFDLLFGRIREGNPQGVWMAVPDILPWERVGGFVYGRDGHQHHDILFNRFLSGVRNRENIDLARFKRRRIKCIDTEGVPMQEWDALQCLNAELRVDGDTFVLSNGKWYKVEHDFVAEVDRAFDQMPVFPQPFPQYRDRNETEYNIRAATELPKDCALMDRVLISCGAGHRSIEFCDLYTIDRELIHVKHYGDSKVFSHFFNQGLNSAEMFLYESDFRTRVNEKLPEQFRLPEDSPDPAHYPIVFAVISGKDGELHLPFFSRMSLRRAAKDLSNMGFSVSKAKIEKDQEFAVTEVAPPS